MTDVPVVFWNANPDAATRGYWDQGLYEAMLAQEQWTAPGVRYVVHDAADAPVGGAVVVVPARHNATASYAARLVAMLDRMDWAVVLLTGDEGMEFPHESLAADRRRVWVMSVRPPRMTGVDQPTGSFFPPGLRDYVKGMPVPEKHHNVVFAGQVTHPRRHELVRMLRHLSRSTRAVKSYATEGFTLGLPQDVYWNLLAQARVAPAPSGPLAVDSMRFYEALELACVPVADGRTPNGPQAFWHVLYGDDVPFPVADQSWADAEDDVVQALQDWPGIGNRCFAWWQQEKRTLAHRLASHARDVSGWAFVPDRPSGEDVTVVIPTSPVPANPDTSHLEETVESVRRHLPKCEVIVTADGVRPEQVSQSARYDEYLRRMLWLTNTRWSDVVPVLAPAWGHQANATRQALALVRRPLMLFMEHDTPLLPDRIDWEGAQALVLSGELNVLRFYHEVAIHPDHLHMMLDGGAVTQMRGVPVVRTSQWSQRPHLCRTDFYRDQVMPFFGARSRTMIEDVMHGVVANAYVELGEPGWWHWRVGIYHPDTVDVDGIKRSTHSDARQGDPKYPMTFAYPGDAPRWAPQPT